MICSACGKECFGIYDDGVTVSNCCGAEIINNTPTGGSGVPRKGLNGGPAFPNVNDMGYGDLGMSLRDYFAAKAMQGMLSDPTRIMNREEVSRESYKIADEMLESREEK